MDEARSLCIKQARVSRGQYRCATCLLLFKAKELRVDHILPVGKFVDWNRYVERLFCPVENLQALCVSCHQEKPNKERK